MLKVVRHRGQGLADLLQDLHRDVGVAAAGVVAARLVEPGPGAFQPVRLVRLVAVGRLELVLQALVPLADHAVGLFRRQQALADQPLGVDLPGGRMLADLLVHQRLGEGRLVALVVAEAPVAEHVDDDVLLEGLAELGRDARDVDHRLGVVAVHVEDRRLDDLGRVGAVGPRARVHRVRGEADLVVDDEVDRAADPVALELGQVEGLGHQALAGEGRVAVHQQGHDLGPVAVAVLHLLGAHLADDHRVHRLQVRGVGGQRQVDGVALEGPVGRGAEVVLDVAGAADVLGMGGAALELREDRREGLAHEVGQDVEAAAVRHADHDLLQAQLAAALEDLLQRRDHGLAAVQAEALGAGVLLVEELLEDLGRGQALQDGALAVLGELGLVLDRFDALLDPGLLGRVLDVHVLDADLAAVGGAHPLDDLVRVAVSSPST